YSPLHQTVKVVCYLFQYIGIFIANLQRKSSTTSREAISIGFKWKLLKRVERVMGTIPSIQPVD
ncbi:MAG: hypothetical protein NFW16_13330, partial [Candidatus Accumulibacter sp.]|uniref:hypothetical protein n=1 Tax=Accumulibacter sp. TaxID=2053492 RepID=UPI00258D2ABC